MGENLVRIKGRTKTEGVLEESAEENMESFSVITHFQEVRKSLILINFVIACL
jgi:hypothetical protein